MHWKSYMVIGPPTGLTVSRLSIPFCMNLASLAFCSAVRLAPVPSLEAHIVGELSRESSLLMNALHLSAWPVFVSFSH